jgi:hypothetical protein
VSHGEHLTERMVDVAHGRSRWTDPEADHLRDCSECAAEWRLTRHAPDLGLGSAIDPERMAEAVLARLAAQPSRRLSPWVRGVVGLAAAAAIVIVALRAGPGNPAVPEALPPVTVLSELDDLTHDELLTVLDVLDPLPDETAFPDAAPLGDLTPSELERVLRSMEG